MWQSRQCCRSDLLLGEQEPRVGALSRCESQHRSASLSTAASMSARYDHLCEKRNEKKVIWCIEDEQEGQVEASAPVRSEAVAAATEAAAAAEEGPPRLERQDGGPTEDQGSHPLIDEEPDEPGLEASPHTAPLGEPASDQSALAAFKRRHYFTFLDRKIYIGRRSAAYSASLNGDLSVENLISKIKKAYRELGIGSLGKRTVKLGMYFSAILRTEDGFRYFSPSFNSSISKNRSLFVISCSDSYEKIARFLSEIPIIDRLSVGLSQKSRDSLVEIPSVQLTFYY